MESFTFFFQNLQRLFREWRNSGDFTVCSGSRGPFSNSPKKLENMVISHSYVKLPESIWETKMGDGALNLECGY